MDTGKIRNLTAASAHTGDAGAALSRGLRSDASAAGAKLVAELLDEVLGRSGLSKLPGAAPDRDLTPLARTGVIVNLSAGLLAPGRDAAITDREPAPDYSHLKAHAAPLRDAGSGQSDGAGSPADRTQASRLPLLFAAPDAAATAPENEQRAAVAPNNPLPASPPVLVDTRAGIDPPTGLIMAALHNPVLTAAEQKPAVSPLSQARDSERLAGLALKAEGTPAVIQGSAGRLLLAAIALGVLLILFF